MEIEGVFKGKVSHARSKPKAHRFSYPVCFYSFDMDKLRSRVYNLPLLFGFNRFSFSSLYEEDYIPTFKGGIRERLRDLLVKFGYELGSERIYLISNPRILGYVFNPVSFFLCYSEENELKYFIAEVHNTFGEKHLYVLGPKERVEDKCIKGKTFYRICKDFHVSPFYDLEGDYEFLVWEKEGEIDIRINLYKDGSLEFTSQLSGRAVGWSYSKVLYSIVLYPLSILGTMPRIMYQAFILAFIRRLKVYTKPIAEGDMTVVKIGAGSFQKLCMRPVNRFLKNIKRGELIINFPDRTPLSFKGQVDGVKAEIEIKNYDFYIKSLFGGDIGFGEAYVEGYWTTNSLVDVVQLFAENTDALNDRAIILSYLGRAKNAVKHFFRRNSTGGSKKNIEAHYDLSNDLFKAFLDKSMMYSSALFRGASSLEEAQKNKIKSLIEKAQITENDHVLEIGCGWGGFAIEAVRQTGCRVTGITLSKEQKAEAEFRISEAGLSDHIDVQLVDYRDVEGQFSKVVSIEMIEAVGHEFLPDYFQRINDLLLDKGLAVIQAITIPDQRYNAYRRGCDWIQKYIFPGGLCPSLGSMIKASSKSTGLVLQSTENLGYDYADTLCEWRKRFDDNWTHIKSLGFDSRFKRIWHYYLAYCEGAFRADAIDTHQLVFKKVT